MCAADCFTGGPSGPHACQGARGPCARPAGGVPPTVTLQGCPPAHLPSQAGKGTASWSLWTWWIQAPPAGGSQCSSQQVPQPHREPCWEWEPLPPSTHPGAGGTARHPILSAALAVPQAGPHQGPPHPARCPTPDPDPTPSMTCGQLPPALPSCPRVPTDLVRPPPPALPASQAPSDTAGSDPPAPPPSAGPEDPSTHGWSCAATSGRSPSPCCPS